MKNNLLRTISRIYFLAFYFFLASSCTTGTSDNSIDSSDVVTTNADDGNVSFDQSFLITFSIPVDTVSVTTSSLFIVSTSDASTLIGSPVAHLTTDLCDPELAIASLVSCSSSTSCELIPDFPLQTDADYRLCLTTDIQFLEPELNGDFLGHEVGFTTNEAVLESLALTPSEVSMDVEDIQQFTVTGTFDDESTQAITDDLVWASSDESFVTVAQDGLATAVALGEAEISVTHSASGLTAVALASVDFPVDEVFRYTVGGTTSGLTGTVVLQMNGGDDLTLNDNGAFTFDTTIIDGEDYEVTVLTQPAGQTCAVVSGSGSVNSAAVTDVSVICTTNTYTLGGNLSGLTGTVVLQNNGGDNLTLNSDGAFVFSIPVAESSSYAVTVLTQPAGQTCTVTNGSGTMSGSDVTNVDVTCVTDDTTLVASVSVLALSVNDTGLNAALTGAPRLIAITNTGVVPATAVTYSPSPALPSGTTISPSSCGTLAPSATCVLTITPGDTPSAVSGDTTPTPITLSISGSNTNTVTPTMNVLTYGSVYQGGYVYAVDDTTPDTGSIGGKVAALTDQSTGVLWSSDGSSSVSYVGILAIDELSTSFSPSPTSPSYPPGTPAYEACNGNSDGACNTSNIVAYYNFNRASGGSAPTPVDQYAAGLCTATMSGYTDWYLPAICEAGYDDLGSGTGCGTQASPTVQNMLSNLFDAGVGGISGEYWTSTEWSGGPDLYAWSQTYETGNVPQYTFDKSYNTIRVRCSRALTP